MQKFTSIILSSRDTNEFDRIYVMYTLEMGLVRAVAKGARKPTAKLAGHLEPGTLSEVYIARSRGLGQITGAITLDSFENVKKDFKKLGGVLGVFRFFGKIFAGGERDERIFELLKNFLSRSSTLGVGFDILVEAFWWKLFDFLGRRPEASKCVVCGRKLQRGSGNRFSVVKGGIICRNCPARGDDTFLISENQIKLIRLFLSNSLEKVAKIKVRKEELAGLGRIRENFRKYNFS